MNLSDGLFSLGTLLAFIRICFLLPAFEAIGPLQITLGKMIFVSKVYLSYCHELLIKNMISGYYEIYMHLYHHFRRILIFNPFNICLLLRASKNKC